MFTPKLRAALALCLLWQATLSHAEGEQRFADLDQCPLESGEVLEDCRIGYRTFGTVDANKSNVLILPTWFTGTTADFLNFDYIGPDKIADTSRFFVIAIDALGNGVSTSPSNSDPQPGAQFPAISIGDIVDTQHRLLTEELDIQSVHAIFGVSMGGMQAFEWVVRYPQFVQNALAVIGTPRQTAYDLMLWQAQLDTILNLAEDDYGSAVRLIAGLDNLTSYTPEYFAKLDTEDELDQITAGAVNTATDFGLANRVPQLQAMITHDVTREFGGSLSGAAASVKARMLIVVSPSDHMVNPEPSRAFAMLADAQYHELDGRCGHMAVACDRQTLLAIVDTFLNGPD